MPCHRVGPLFLVFPPLVIATSAWDENCRNRPWETMSPPGVFEHQLVARIDMARGACGQFDHAVRLLATER